MNNLAIVPTRSDREAHAVILQAGELSMLRAELELMIQEDTYLKKIAGAAALLVARLDRVTLSGGTATTAFILAGLIEGLPEEMVSEAISLLKSS